MLSKLVFTFLLGVTATTDEGTFADLNAEFDGKEAAKTESDKKIDEDTPEETVIPNAVSYPLLHCLNDRCFDRGTLQLGSRSAKIDDSAEFVKMRDSSSLREMLEKEEGFYSVKLLRNPTDTKDDPKAVAKALSSSIPIELIENPEDLHDSLEISLAAENEIVAINYRTTAAWGLQLFEHTAVRLLKPRYSYTPTIPPKPVKGANAPVEQGGILGILKRYWWMILIGMVLMTAITPAEEPQSGSGGAGKRK